MKKRYNTQSLSKRRLSNFTFILLFLIFPFTSNFAQCDQNYVQIGSYHIEFVGVEYDYPTTGQSTWYYTVFATSGKDISHVTFPLGKHCINVLEAGYWGNTIYDLSPNMGDPSVGKDPKAKIWGIKFDKGIDSGEAQNYYFTVEGNLAVEPVEEVAIKAGKPFYKGTVCGPSPDCSEVVDEPLVSCISGMAFHDSNRNGIRDVDENPVSGVTVRLYNSSGSIGELETDDLGEYSFCDLEVGIYNVRMITSFDRIITLKNVGSDDYDSDLMTNGYTENLEIFQLGNSYSNVDGGYYSFGVWDQQLLNGGDPSQTISSNGAASNQNQAINGGTNLFITGNKNNTVYIFPNPVVKTATFDLPAQRKGDAVIEFRDQSGNLLLTSTVPADESVKQIDLDILPMGVYNVFIIFDGGVTVKRVIKFNMN